MKYFEVSSPYYALLKAESKEKAKEKYIEHVADKDGSLDVCMNEVGRDYALARFSQTPLENKKLVPVKQVLEDFHAAEYEVLIIDSALI
ncbi:hypothetical protein ABW02_06920 [Niallia circulans]|uniref:Uncharacterized protein n=1 Tax=Niallia circulans TaxID=1397 RepID=A0A0J1LEA9_NIACI|nr:hypothetical protein [Niallia circulans]KLV27245.1 hypothetical protein ABW02_06920 [Niallia circulans]